LKIRTEPGREQGSFSESMSDLLSSRRSDRMRHRTRWWGCGVLLAALVFLTQGYGQEKSLQVSEQELRKAAIYKPEPEYPAVARQIRVVGDVELMVAVDPTGQVDKVTITRGNTLLAGPCAQAIKKWKFNPFRADGQAVHAVGPVKFTFQM
jgi:TonB family protein